MTTLKRKKESTWVIPLQENGVKTKVGNRTIYTAPQPWYPYGQEVEIVSSQDATHTVRTLDGKVWPHPVYFYNLENNT